MARKKAPIDYEALYKEAAKINRKLAKRANQRLVRLEHAAKKRGMTSILGYAYKSAVKDTRTLGKTKGKPRFKENPKLVDIFDSAGKPLTGQALYKANYLKQLTAQKMMKEFLNSASSTIGQGLADAAVGLNRTIGIERIWDKTTRTINERFLEEYDLRLSDNDMKRFWESRKQAKLEADVGSSQMFAVAAVMKKFNLTANKRNFEKFLRDHVNFEEEDITKDDIKSVKGENFKAYFDRVSKYAKYTDDEVLNDYVNKAIKDGINARNIFI